MASVAFIRIAELASALGVRQIKNTPGCWEHQIDETWRVAVNPHREQQEIPARDGHMGASIPHAHAAVWYYGWLAGLLSPAGGPIAAGDGANEETLIAALEAAIRRAGKEPEDFGGEGPDASP